VRVIGAEGEQVGILSRDEALAMAQEAGLDLVEIQPNGDPPVCRIMDFGKFKFEQQKKAHAARKKTKQVEIKELKFRPTTDIGDYTIKLRNLLRFLEEGDKVKVTETRALNYVCVFSRKRQTSFEDYPGLPGGSVGQ
jgi:translation initiation factor IF-3